MAEQKRRGCDVTTSVSSVGTFDDLRTAFADGEGAWNPRGAAWTVAGA